MPRTEETTCIHMCVCGNGKGHGIRSAEETYRQEIETSLVRARRNLTRQKKECTKARLVARKAKGEGGPTLP